MKRGSYRVDLLDAIIGILSMFLFLFLTTLVVNSIGSSKTYGGNGENVVQTSGKITVNSNDSTSEYIKVYLRDKNIVEKMKLEDYIIGVLAAEMPAEFELEALKAQCVAARTYAIAHMKSWGGISCVEARKYDADICDSTHCQVYIDENNRKKKWGKEYKKFNKKIEDAVKATAGVVITYNNEIIDSPYYFAASSGTTELAEEVFQEGRPYLKSVQSYGDSRAPKATSTKRIDKIDFIKTIKANYKDIQLYKGSLMDNIEIVKRTLAGNVKSIKIGKIEMSGIEFRRLFALNSADFIINDDGNELVVFCQGYGHEVGMSQWGANAMAQIGNTYSEIIEHYYKGTKTQKVY